MDQLTKQYLIIMVLYTIILIIIDGVNDMMHLYDRSKLRKLYIWGYIGGIIGYIISYRQERDNEKKNLSMAQ